MVPLTHYLDGVVRVPLRLLTSDGFAECPASFSARAAVLEFNEFLSNKGAPITGIVTPEVMLSMLRAMGITLARFRETLQPHQEPLDNNSIEIGCLVGAQCLAKAREILGTEFICTVRIYCLPEEMPGQFSDGDILRRLLLLPDDPKEEKKWMRRLTIGKQRHVKRLQGRLGIWRAMRRVARFPALWEDIQIGNFAKHLAAHCDEAFESYWMHIDKIWTAIFRGLESQIPVLDPETVRQLQYMAPARCKVDQEKLHHLITTKEIFRNIHDENYRALLHRNITAFDVIIPSPLTFHENKRYITIGLKILEKHLLPKEKIKRGEKPRNLIKRLEGDWNQSATPKVEVKEGLFKEVQMSSRPARVAFISLLLVALRNFPMLGSEAPYHNIKGEGMQAFIRKGGFAKLYQAASTIGYRNQKVTDGLAVSGEPTLSTANVPRQLLVRWRGGKPSNKTFLTLQQTTFVPNFSQCLNPNSGASPSWVLYDMLIAFFGDDFKKIAETGTGVTHSITTKRTRGSGEETWEDDFLTKCLNRTTRRRLAQDSEDENMEGVMNLNTQQFAPPDIANFVFALAEPAMVNAASVGGAIRAHADATLAVPPQLTATPTLSHSGASSRLEEEPDIPHRSSVVSMVDAADAESATEPQRAQPETQAGATLAIPPQLTATPTPSHSRSNSRLEEGPDLPHRSSTIEPPEVAGLQGTNQQISSSSLPQVGPGNQAPIYLGMLHSAGNASATPLLIDDDTFLPDVNSNEQLTSLEEEEEEL